ncbi:IS21-like element helper ATPase IstB [bacterium]|nr:IS21-like element helper ATPase IstB [bacterium]
MGVVQNKNILQDLKLMGMLHEYDRILSEGENGKECPSEIVGSLLQAEKDFRDERKIQTRIKTSKLKLYPEYEEIDFTAKRNLAKNQIRELFKLNWLKQGRQILLIGPTGVGKTFLAQALGLAACRSKYSVIFFSVTTFIENVMLSRTTNSYLKYRDKLSKPDLLILDDLGLRKFTDTEAQDLCELLEERAHNKSTIITTQLPLSHWKEVISDPVIADAIIDRLIHSSIKVEISGESYRKIKAKKLDEKERKK